MGKIEVDGTNWEKAEPMRLFCDCGQGIASAILFGLYHAREIH